jgi:hypothetical protein
LKLEALESYIKDQATEKDAKVPSVLIKSTGQSRISKMPHDPADSIIFGGKFNKQ